MPDDQKTTWKLADLKEWADNPRGIMADDFERLKKQIKTLGVYKPTLIAVGSPVVPDGTVIGGNMRLKAYQDLGIEDVWVSIVSPQTQEELVAYALSDNDRAGYYEEQKIAELAVSVPTLDLTQFKIDLGHAVPLPSLVQSFSPDTTAGAANSDESSTTGGAPREQDTNDLDRLADNYLNQAVKQIVLYFPSAEYPKILERLEAVRLADGLEDNSQALLKLLDVYEQNRATN